MTTITRGGDAAHAHDFMLRGFGAQLLVNVHGEERRAGVEDAGQRTHQRREQAGDDDAAQARRQEMLHQQREGPLRAVGLVERLGQRGDLAALGQRVADQAGNDEQVNREQLQERGEDAALARDLFVRRAERALDDVLVGAPIPQADDRRADGHAQPGEIAVEIPRLLDHVAGGIEFLHRRPRGHLPAGTSGFQRLNMSEPQMRLEFVPAAQLDEAVNGQQGRAGDQDDNLNGVVVGHGAHAAEHGVKPGQHDDRDRSRSRSCRGGRAQVQPQLRQQGAEHHAAGEDADGDLGDDEGEQRGDGKHVARVGAESPSPGTPAW